MISVTALAPINIALLKYWGKRGNSALNLPSAPSLSITLDLAPFHTRTTVTLQPTSLVPTDGQDVVPVDNFTLNGAPAALTPRLNVVIQRLRALRRAVEQSGKDTELLFTSSLNITSENTVPTAAGLASSASGIACLVFTLANAFRLMPHVSTRTLSAIARMGSGSACRSLYGGFVVWHAGDVNVDSTTANDLAETSSAEQLFPPEHWPELCVVLLVVSRAQKSISSTEAMKRTATTSTLYPYRVQNIVNQRLKLMIQAIHEKDFATLAKEMMRDSNQFHALCLDTYPPVRYLNDTSFEIMQMVEQWNAEGEIKAGYTFDAGPNAVIILREMDVEVWLNRVVEHFGMEWMEQPMNVQASRGVVAAGKSRVEVVILTRLGQGPCFLSA